MTKRVMVTGGAGFLGTFVVEQLRQKDWCSDVFVPRSARYDLRDKEAVIRMYKNARPDIVIHLAGVVEGTDPRITAGARQRLDDLSREWEQRRVTLDRLLGPELDSWNAMVRDAEIPAVGVGAGSQDSD